MTDEEKLSFGDAIVRSMENVGESITDKKTDRYSYVVGYTDAMRKAWEILKGEKNDRRKVRRPADLWR